MRRDKSLINTLSLDISKAFCVLGKLRRYHHVEFGRLKREKNKREKKADNSLL